MLDWQYSVQTFTALIFQLFCVVLTRDEPLWKPLKINWSLKCFIIYHGPLKGVILCSILFRPWSYQRQNMACYLVLDFVTPVIFLQHFNYLAWGRTWYLINVQPVQPVIQLSKHLGDNWQLTRLKGQSTHIWLIDVNKVA